MKILLILLRLSDDQWVGFQLPSVKHTRALHGAFFALDKDYLQPNAAALSHLFFLHLWHALGES